MVMPSYENAGRITKQAFIVSNLTLFVLCLICVCARFYIKIFIHRQFLIDDGILLFGVLCSITAMGLLYTFLDQIYLIRAAELKVPGLQLPPDFVQMALKAQKMSIAALVLTWTSIVAVKFSYLFLFKRLIDRIRPLILIWWIAVVFNAIVSIYGVTVYFTACLHWQSEKALQCTFGKGVKRLFAFSCSHMVLDIVGDLLILYIPCRLIYDIKIQRRKKIALLSSLCLTAITVMCTITRVSGVNPGSTNLTIDPVWGAYWQYVTAHVALTMTAATAFRTLFVSHGTGDTSPSASHTNSSHFSVMRRGFLCCKSKLRPTSRISKTSLPESNDSGVPQERSASWNQRGFQDYHPCRKKIMGIRTFIESSRMKDGSRSQSTSDVSKYHQDEKECMELPKRGITVSHDFVTKSDRASTSSESV